MFFFLCNLSSFDDKKETFYLFPTEQNVDENGLPVFSEKELTAHSVFKQFVKDTKTAVVDVEYILFKTDANITAETAKDEIQELIQNDLVERIDGNSFSIPVGKFPKSNKGSDKKQTYLFAGIIGVVVLIMIISSAVKGAKNSESDSEISDSSDISDNSEIISESSENENSKSISSDFSDQSGPNDNIVDENISENESLEEISDTDYVDEPIVDETEQNTDDGGYTEGGYNDYGSGYSSANVQSEYTITFNANGGEGALDSISALSDSAVKLPDVSEASKKLTRKGYMLLGFSDNKDINYPLTSYKMPYENTTLYAVWEPCEYTVTYNSNGGIGQLSAANVKYNKNVPLPTDIAIYKEGLNLIGWNTDKSAKTALKSLKMPDKNTTLYAVWSDKKPTFKVTFHYDDKVMVREFEKGEKVNMRDSFDVKKDGYTLSGWYFENGEKPLSYLEITSDCDVYGRWVSDTYITITVDQSYLNKPAVTYKVLLDMNGEAKFRTPKITDKVFGCTYGFSTRKQSGQFGEIEYFSDTEYTFKKDVTLYCVLNEYGGGKGTANDPFIISSYEHLLYLSRQGAKGYFKQTADIKFPNNANRKPIDTVKISKGFEDKNADLFIYDGDDHVIKNIRGEGGLFGNISSSTLKNIRIDSSEISVKSGSGGILCNEVTSYYFGSADGKAYATGNSEIINCRVTNSSISGESAENIGVICGFGGVIENCVSEQNLIYGKNIVGGIVGNAVTVRGCLSTNNSAEGAIVGGIAGTATGAMIIESGDKSSAFGGNITGCAVVNFAGKGNYCGGFVGQTCGITDGFIRSCYAAGIILGGTSTGSISGGDGDGQMPHRFSYCVIDNSGNYPVVGGTNTRSRAVKMVMSTPKENIRIDGVLSVLNAKDSGFAKWVIDPEQNGGYPIIGGLK